MERIAGFIVGSLIAIGTLAVIFLVAGGAIIGAVTALLAIPIAAPITTTIFIVMIIVGYFVYRKKTPRNKDEP